MDDKVNKILYILTKPDLGGVSNYILEIVKRLPEKYTPYFVMSNEGYLTNELEKLGYKDNIFIVPMTNSIVDFKTHIKSNLQTLKIIHKIKPDLIHCNSTTGGIVGRICGFLSKTPVIFTAHGWAFTNGIAKKKQIFYKILETALAALTSKIICVSEYDRKLALEVMPICKNKLLTIHNGISDIPESLLKDWIEIENKKNLDIVMISRFCPQKDPYTLIDAVDELNREGLNLNLNIYGYGEEQEKVISSIKNCNNERIAFKGRADNISEILKNNDIYALISNWEGLPIGIIEAMRSGLPIIACNVGGNSEVVIEGKNGFVIPRSNKELLKNKIKHLYEDRNTLKKMGEFSRILYDKDFRTDYMCKKTFDVYKDLL